MCRAWYYIEVVRDDKKNKMEQYSSGWIGAPAKGIGRATGARVQIPPAPPL